MSDKIVYNIVNRGDAIIAHWFFFMMAGLKDIFEGKPVISGNDYLKTHITGNYEKPSLPIKICFKEMENMLEFHHDTLKIISDKVVIIKKEEIEKYQIINSYGAPLTKNNFVTDDYIFFLRNLFLEKTNYIYDNKKYIYISRNKARECVNSPSYNITRRTIKNEKELMNKYLNDLGFKLVYLEDYSVEEKIKLFNTSSIIISPFGGALTFTMFANNKTNIIEICPTHYQVGGLYKQWEWITSCLKIPYTSYKKLLDQDSQDNMTIKIEPLVEIVKKIIIDSQ